MTPSELEFKLKSLPPNTPITAEHIIAILGALQAPQVITNNAGAYSTWDNENSLIPKPWGNGLEKSPND